MRAVAAGFVATASLGMVLSAAATSAEAQTLTADMLAPSQGGFAPAAQSPLRRTADNGYDRVGELRTGRASSRIGNPPIYAVAAAAGAADTGFDSLNRKRRKPKPYPGTPQPKFVGPGNPPVPTPPPARVTAPVAPAVAGSVAGQPPRRRLKVEDDPFGNVGFHTGSFLTKAAVEVGGGYDSNPGRLNTPKGSAFYKVSPELQAVSDWSRHAVAVDLRGSFTGYDRTFASDTNFVSPVPTRIDRPDFTGKVDGRLDVTRDTRINSQLRLRVGTDNPGSPNIQVGLAKYPLFATSGATLGVEQDINHLQVSLSGTVDHTAYQNSTLTDGTTSTNDDRNFNQYGGIARVSYDLMPGLKPFTEVEADSRTHQTAFDRSGYARNSTGGYAKAGTTFEFSRLLTGEIAAGYALRNYEDARLSQMKGLLTSASLVWAASGLTTVRLNATSSIDETTLPGVSGALSRDYALTVDHAFRRWLIGTAKIGYGTSDYGGARFDKRYFAEADLVYKLSRTFHIKASVRRDWLDSSIVGASSSGTIVMLGLRVQR